MTTVVLDLGGVVVLWGPGPGGRGGRRQGAGRGRDDPPRPELFPFTDAATLLRDLQRRGLID